MANIETQIEPISQQISNLASQSTIYFPTLDPTYSYSQQSLPSETADHCYFKIIRGDMRGTYRFQIGTYGLTDMRAEIQKGMDYTLIELGQYLLLFS